MASELAITLAELTGWTNVHHAAKFIMGQAPGRAVCDYAPIPDEDGGDCMDLIFTMMEKGYNVELSSNRIKQVWFEDRDSFIWTADHDDTPAGIRRAVCDAARDALRAQKDEGE